MISKTHLGDYVVTVKTLRTADEKILLEMFHDIEDIEIIERIADCAAYFVENFDRTVEEVVNDKSEVEDWKHQDDARRYNDYKSDVEL